MKKPAFIALLAVILTAAVFAQRGRRNRWGDSGEMPKTAREARPGDTDLPAWTNPPAYAKDVFTFCRVIYDSGYGGYSRGGWATDLMERRGFDGGGGCSDINLSWRLQQMTSMKTDPDGRLLRLTDPDLPNYPFIYMVEPGALYLSEEEAKALREYLLNGGFLMMDDFWGETALENVTEQLKKVFPEREFFEIPLDHQLYHCVFDIKSKGQVPNMQVGDESQETGETWEHHFGEDTRTVHHKGISDDKGRLMMIACHNTDNGDGWEREAWSDYYFHNFSEKISYPLGVNIIFYAMTH